jgi:hypothetical protein
MSFSKRYAAEKTAGFPPPQEGHWDWPSDMGKDFMITDSTLPEINKDKSLAKDEEQED